MKKIESSIKKELEIQHQASIKKSSNNLLLCTKASFGLKLKGFDFYEFFDKDIAKNYDIIAIGNCVGIQEINIEFIANDDIYLIEFSNSNSYLRNNYYTYEQTKKTLFDGMIIFSNIHLNKISFSGHFLPTEHVKYYEKLTSENIDAKLDDNTQTKKLDFIIEELELEIQTITSEVLYEKLLHIDKVLCNVYKLGQENFFKFIISRFNKITNILKQPSIDYVNFEIIFVLKQINSIKELKELASKIINREIYVEDGSFQVNIGNTKIIIPNVFIIVMSNMFGMYIYSLLLEDYIIINTKDGKIVNGREIISNNPISYIECKIKNSGGDYDRKCIYM